MKPEPAQILAASMKTGEPEREHDLKLMQLVKNAEATIEYLAEFPVDHYNEALVRGMAWELRLKGRPALALMLCRQLVRAKMQLWGLLHDCIYEPPHLTTFLTMYWEQGRCPIAGHAKLEMRAAIGTLYPAEMVKYHRSAANKAGTVTLRDVFGMLHPSPKWNLMDAVGAEDAYRIIATDP
jgi:hypothetical protein